MSSGTIIGNCQAESPLTGVGNCPKQEGKIASLIITNRNAYFPLEGADFKANLDDYVSADGSQRIWPIKNVVGMVLNGGDINAPDLGTYGGPAPTNINALNVAYQIDAGDCLYKELIKFNKRKVRIFRVDDEGYVYGTVITRNGEQYFAGFETTLYALRTPTDGSTAYNLSLYAYYTVNLETEEKNMHAVNVGLTNVPDGLIGVVLKAATGGGAKVVTSCAGEDITSDYADEWDVKMFVNSAGANPTSVAYNSATGLLTIEPASKYRVAPAKILETAGITGLDGLEEFATVSDK